MVENHAQSTTMLLARPSAISDTTTTANATPMPLQGMFPPYTRFRAPAFPLSLRAKRSNPPACIGAIPREIAALRSQ